MKFAELMVSNVIIDPHDFMRIRFPVKKGSFAILFLFQLVETEGWAIMRYS